MSICQALLTRRPREAGNPDDDLAEIWRQAADAS